MLSLAIFIVLIFGFLIGLKRGFILQLIHITGFIIAFIVAYIYYGDLAPKLTLWIPYPNFSTDSTFQLLLDNGHLEAAYYNAISFVGIFLAVKIAMQIIGNMLDFVANLPILKTLNVWAGGILGFLEVYLVIFILLYIAALLPVDAVQDALGDSFLAKMIVEHTPYFSSQIKELWIEHIAS
ncbi:CvpA family protein [Robertmurraya andreesenii]|uniref:Membrane protein required for colicin V production n=1 Tax=Anoxybacillus andreesenii TaxID=1325932 RepID=A0ABT9V8X3_9BACL|nr:CvpA family protein [Robertmurraya andreesenii]MDQ0157367.1 putative membrane protein required for colicin V production [Robertmurraya andreesenii]